MKKTLVKIINTKSCFLEKINKIDNALVKLNKKREKTKINNIRKEKEVTADHAEIKGS